MEVSRIEQANLSNPVQFMVQHRAVIMDAYKKSSNSPSKTWSILQESLPEIETAMKYNTFKQYLSAFVPMVEEHEKAARELDAARLRITELEAQLRLDKVVQTDEAEVIQGKPKNIDGWNVQQGKDGYYRLYKKIGGQVKTLYLGRSLDLETARRKIRKKEQELKGRKRRAAREDQL